VINLKTCRKKIGMKQREIAELLGISTRAYQTYELGEREPSLAMAIKIADFLCVSIDFLVGRSDDPEYKKYVIQEQKRLFGENKSEEYYDKYYEEHIKEIIEKNFLQYKSLLKVFSNLGEK